MDETANQMGDVREELADVLRATLSTGYPYVGADAILARFEVTEKPVVSDEALGEMVNKSHSAKGDNAASGQWLKYKLADAGLTIVRSGEGTE